MKLLSRDEFRVNTLKRSGGICCVPNCGENAVDAHHILNRNLFQEPHEEGGYFLENGSQLCSKHHYQAELTLITVEDLRKFCNILEPALPAQFTSDNSYDCWGNQIIAGDFRIAGPMFNDSGCQKALQKAGVLWKFVS